MATKETLAPLRMVLGSLLGLLMATCSPGRPDEAGKVCPTCRAAGGETSDFGREPKTMCELSETRVPISEVDARNLGFSETLDLFPRSFASPFEWTPNAAFAGWPEFESPQGFSPSATLVTLQSNIVSLGHLVPQLDGCADRLSITLHVALKTKDGAISIAGDLLTTATRNPKVEVRGDLDLSTAQGSLRIFSPQSPSPLVGYLRVYLGYWPDMVRGEVSTRVFAPDDRTYGTYDPIYGEFPSDGCGPIERPVDPSVPVSSLSDATPIELHNKWVTQIKSQQPAAGIWKDGSLTSVTVEVGSLTSVCEYTYASSSKTSITFLAPVRLTTSDGRVALQSTSKCSLDDEATGVPTAIRYQMYNDNYTPVGDFSSVSGISGVDLSAFRGANWGAYVALDQKSGKTSGVLGVRGSSADPYLPEVDVDRLCWPLDAAECDPTPPVSGITASGGSMGTGGAGTAQPPNTQPSGGSGGAAN